MCQAGFDFLIIDGEHGPVDFGPMEHLVQVANLMGVPIVVRIPWNEPVVIKRVLDLGSNGILVPLCTTVEEVKGAIEATRYPPQGIRGFGPRRPTRYGRLFGEYIESANESVLVFIQIEHIDAVRNVEGILAVPGVDGLLIGFNDLSASIGLLGQPAAPAVLELADEVIKKASRASVAVGAAVGGVEQAVNWLQRGAQFATVGSDCSFLVQAADEGVRRVKAQLTEVEKQTTPKVQP